MDNIINRLQKNGLLNTVLCITISLLMGGCESIGPSSIRRVHYEYNDAIAKITVEQFFKSIIRLKYLDPICFLEVSSINENRKFTTRLGPSSSKIGLVSNSGKHELGILCYSEFFQNPTVTYVPLQGEKFTKRMNFSIPWGGLVALMQNEAYPPKSIFSLFVERINNLKPSDKAFADAVNLIDILCKQDLLHFGLDPENQKNLFLKFEGSNEQIQKLKLLIGLDPDISKFPFSSNFLDMNSNNITERRPCSFKEIFIRTSSLMETLMRLSKFVNVPQEDIQKGFVVEATNKTLGEIFTINYSESQRCPSNAFICDFYRGKWFYIADNDLNSKWTLMLLIYLFNLQSGDSRAFIPPLMISTN